MPSIELNGTRTLVLGGSGVLGSLIAAELRRRGGRVVLAGRNTERLQERATALGTDVSSVEFDLRQAHHARHVVQTAVTLMGGIDGLINAAGVVGFGPLDETPDAALEEIIITDLLGPLRVVRELIPHLDGGFIVNLTGVVAEQPVAGMAAYSAAKAGLSAATRALGRELRRRGVHVMDARPPHTETGLADRRITGDPPPMPAGLDPQIVAVRVVDGLADGARELPAAAFSTG